MLADKAEGRTISMVFHVKLTPVQSSDLSDTGAEAAAIGRGLIRESMMLLKAAGEREGFVVDISVTNRVVY